MQFYLNGYKTGDPFVEEPHPSVAERPGGLPEDADVLIVGCGPAGLVLAAQLANFPDIRTVVIDRRDGPLEVGPADGVACRTVEMFEAFGLATRLIDEGCWVNEVSVGEEHHLAPAENRSVTPKKLTEVTNRMRRQGPRLRAPRPGCPGQAHGELVSATEHDVAEVILQRAKELDVDLIVLGHQHHRGPGGFRSSVAERVIHQHPPYSILMARPPQHA